MKLLYANIKKILIFCVLVNLINSSSSPTKASQDNDILEERTPHKIRILTIDGGGARGSIPAAIIDQLEEELHKRLGCDISIAQCFDVMGGTSTGGIIVLGLNIPNNTRVRPQHLAKKLVSLYKEEGKNIFPANGWVGINSWMSTVRGAFAPIYDSTSLTKILENFFQDINFKGNESKPYLLSDAFTRVMITSYNASTNNIHYFDRGQIPQPGSSENYSLKDVALATSAAPVYFPASYIINRGGITYKYIDGGMFANNPTLGIFARLLNEYPQSEFFILSLGTGKAKTVIDTGKEDNIANKGGKWTYAAQAASIIMQGASDHNDDILRLLRANKNLTYHRIETIIPLDYAQMDDPNNANELDGLARDTIKNFDYFEEIVRELEGFCKDGSLIQRRLARIKIEANKNMRGNYEAFDFNGIPLTSHINKENDISEYNNFYHLSKILSDVNLNSTISRLNLSNTALGRCNEDLSLSQILNTIFTNLPTLTHLDLSDNNFSKMVHLESIINFIRQDCENDYSAGKRTGLHTLILRGCSIEQLSISFLLKKLSIISQDRYPKRFHFKRIDFRNNKNPKDILHIRYPNYVVFNQSVLQEFNIQSSSINNNFKSLFTYHDNLTNLTSKL